MNFSRENQNKAATVVPPACPVYILRGHTAAVHALHFYRNNTRLLSGDAGGSVMLWSLRSKRPYTNWKAHNGAILGLGDWRTRFLITQGRDNRLAIWTWTEEDENQNAPTQAISAEASMTASKSVPQVLYTLEVNTVNFCSFACCEYAAGQKSTAVSRLDTAGESGDVESMDAVKLIFALCGKEDGEISIVRLPRKNEVGTIPCPPRFKGKLGMLMAVRVLYRESTGSLNVVAGYESGQACVYRSDPDFNAWQLTYACHPHTQPILALDVSPDLRTFFTSSADALVSKQPLLVDPNPSFEEPIRIHDTKHSGQQSLVVRSDGLIFATAGWDHRIRIYSSKTLAELAVLQWHRQGCFAVAFATVLDQTLEARATADFVVDRYSDIKRSSFGRRPLVQITNWVAAGSKDGRISLWDIY